MQDELNVEWTKMEDISYQDHVLVFGSIYKVSEKFENETEIFLKFQYIKSENGEEDPNPLVSIRAYRGAKLTVVK